MYECAQMANLLEAMSSLGGQVLTTFVEINVVQIPGMAYSMFTAVFHSNERLPTMR